MAQGEYRFLFYDIATNTALGELEVASVRYSRVLDGVGSMTGSIPLGDSRVTAKNPWDLTALVKRKVYVVRNQTIAWGPGTIWTRVYDDGPSGRSLDIGATEMWAQFRTSNYVGRYVVDTLSWAQKDQLAIFRDLIAYAQGQPVTNIVGGTRTYPKPGGNLGVVLGAETSGVLRDLTYDRSSYQEIGDACQQLSALDRGFDFSIDSTFVGQSPVDTLVLSYPRRGLSVQNAGVPRILQKPGNILGYRYPEDGTGFATTAYALGDGQGDAMMRSSAWRTDLIDQKYPLRELRVSYKGSGITAQGTLDAHARADEDAHAAIVTLPTVRFRPDDRCPIGGFTTGDDLRVLIDDERFPSKGYGGTDQHLDTALRLISYEVLVPSGQQGEEVTATLGATF